MDNLPKSFYDLINNHDKPVLVDFYTDWCGPCKVLSPTIKQIAHEYKNKLLTVKINTDRKQDIAMQYQITSIPTVMLFHKGQSLMRLQGALPYEALKEQIDKNLPA